MWVIPGLSFGNDNLWFDSGVGFCLSFEFVRWEFLSLGLFWLKENFIHFHLRIETNRVWKLTLRFLSLSLWMAISGSVEIRTSCDHLASLASDLTHIPAPDTPCYRFTFFSHIPTLLYFYHFYFLQNINFYLKKNYNHTYFVLELLWSTASINFNNWNHSLKLLAWK